MNKISTKNIIRSVAFFGIIIISIEILFAAYNFNDKLFGAMIGKALIYSIISVLILPRKFIKNHTCVLVIPLLLSVNIAFVDAICRQKNLRAEFVKDLNSFFIFYNESNSGQIFSDDQLSHMNLGLLLEEARVINNYNKNLQKIIKNLNEYLDNTFNSFGLNDMGNKKSRAKSKQKLVLIRQRLERDKISIMDEIKDTFVKLKASKKMPNQATKRMSIKILEDTERETISFYNKYFALKNKIINSIQNIYLFLDERSSRFVMVDSNLVFNLEKDRQNFDKLVSNLEKSFAEEEEFFRSIDNQLKDSIKKSEDVF